MQTELKSMRLFSPIFPRLYLRDDYGDIVDEPEELSTEEALGFEDKINAFIKKMELPSERKRGLAEYLDGSLEKKVFSMRPKVEEWGGKLWCVTEVELLNDLSCDEFSELTDWLSGQFSDGWGEGMEQREIKVHDGELYVSFWDSNDRFFIKPENELKGEQSTSSDIENVARSQNNSPVKNYDFFPTSPCHPIKINDQEVQYHASDEFSLTPHGKPFEVEMVVELSHQEFSKFANQPDRKWDFIADNKEYMFYNASAGNWHGLLILGEGWKSGYILDSAGSDYPVDRVFVPNARQMVESAYPEMQYSPEKQQAPEETEGIGFSQTM